MAKGSIYPYELSDGSTRYSVVFRTSNGVQRRRRGFRGVREAERFLNKTMAGVDAGQVVATKDTFASYIDRWLREHRPRIEEGTYRDYRVHVERRLKPFFGEMKLSDITPGEVRRYVAELVDAESPGATFGGDRVGEAQAVADRLGSFTVSELADELGSSIDAARRLIATLMRAGAIAAAGSFAAPGSRGRRHRLYRIEPRRGARDSVAPRRISAKTINNSLIPLRLALAHAVEDGLIAANPAASAPGARRRIKVAVDHREMDFLRLNEIASYLEACSAAYRPLAELLIACGLRISEALHLTWADVDLDGRVVLITGSRKRGRGEGTETAGSTKGDRSRAVEFGPRIAGILRDLRATEAEHRSADLRSRPVFATPEGGRLSRHTVSGSWHKDALRDGELRATLRLHDLRHTAAASWLAAGLPLIYVQRQLGHASITTTEAQYGHLEKGFLRGAASRAEAVVWEGRVEAPAAALA